MPETLLEQPLVIDPGSPRPRRPWPLRFSLWTLCLVVAAACVVAAWFGMRSRERAALARAAALQAEVEAGRAEISRLRAELGYLTIGDPAQVHAVQLPTNEDYHWKWRVYLPPGNWRLCSGLGQIPKQGLEGVSHGMATLDSGERTIEAYFDRDAEGHRRFVVVVQGVSRASQSVDEASFEALQKAGYSGNGIGGSTTEVIDPTHTPIVLMRLRKFKPIPGIKDSYASSDDPEFGFLLWVE